jgi:hypothetical protein
MEMPVRPHLALLVLVIVAAIGGAVAMFAARAPDPVTTYPVELPLLLDMTHPIFDDSPPGYVRVLPSDVYTPERGFGWSRNVLVFDANTYPYDRLNLDSLHRDSHMGLNTPGEPAAVFRIDVSPGSYLLTVVAGPAVHGPHALGLIINGEEALPLRETPADGKPTVLKLTVSPREGRIEVHPFTEVGTEWLIAAIELRPADEP